jgi:protein-disulfide isomerase
MKAFVFAAAALGLFAVGCQQQAASAPATGDMTLGPASAKVTITEYAAPSCPVCKGFHDDVFKPLKAKYIDTGKVQFVLKEMPSHNPPVDVAVFLLARCAGKDKYFSVIDAAFDKQRDIEMSASSPAGARPALVELARGAGLSESQANSCMTDPAGMRRIIQTADAETRANNIAGTPTILIDGVKTGREGYSLEGLSALIDAKLAAAK